MMQDWKIEEQKLYVPSTEPHAVHIPKQFFFIIDARGGIGSEDFYERLHVLSALSEAVRNISEHGYSPPGFTDYLLYPPETLHHPEEQGGHPATFSLMIRQPDFIDNETIDRAFNALHRERKFPLLPEVAFEEFEDALSVQLRSSKKDETAVEAFKKMDHFLLANNWKRRNLHHREIYPEYMKGSFDELVYRVFVEEAE